MVELSINPELFAIVPEPTKEDYAALKKSIETSGQHRPITVWKDPHSGKVFIIDGHSRYEACKQLKVKPIIEYKDFESWLDAMRYAIQVNSKRRHLTQIQKVNLAIREIEIEKELAKERQKSTIPKKEQKGFQKMPNGIHTGSTCDIVSKKTGISTRTVARLKRIIDDGSEELKKDVASGKKSAASAERIIKLEKAHTKPISLPVGKSDVIEADPPWQYDYQMSGAPDYPTMETDKIIDLKDNNGRPVTDTFAKDAILLLWVSRPKLEDGLRVLRGWEFTYKTCLTWEKVSEGKPQKGTGHYVISTSELLLIGIKGKPGTPLPENRPLDIIKAPRGKRHSEKPDIHPMIEKMYPNRKYLELFARVTANGWNCWGNQIETSENNKTKLDDF